MARTGLTIPVVDSWFTEDAGIIIMPLLRETLQNYLATHTIEENKIIMEKVLVQIEKLHGKYIHNDLHGNNIMLDENDNIFFIDVANTTPISREVDKNYAMKADYNKLLMSISKIGNINELAPSIVQKVRMLK